MSQSDPTDHALATIASIFEHPEPTLAVRETETEAAVADEHPVIGEHEHPVVEEQPLVFKEGQVYPIYTPEYAPGAAAQLAQLLREEGTGS